MPARLRPTAPIAAEAILVGDPGRALILAQELLQQPKMSNHARGLWGYTGVTHAGDELTIQSTGMGGPSATVVLHDLAELGVRRAVRIGTCTSLGELELGQVVKVTEARASNGEVATPSLELPELGAARAGSIVSLDILHRHAPQKETGADGADMQTAALFAAAGRLDVAVAALLIVAETAGGQQLGDEELEAAAKSAGQVAAAILST